MEFYHSPQSCSQATHILLREAGLSFTPHAVDIFAQKLDDGTDYALIHPNGYVPALVLQDGTLLTETVAIIDWISARATALLPDGDLSRTRHLQMLAFLSTEVHRPSIPLFFLEDAAAQAQIRDTVIRRIDWVATRLQGDYLFGDRFSGADAFLYVMLRWAAMLQIETPERFVAFVSCVESRPAVQATLAAEAVNPLAVPQGAGRQ